MIDGLVHLALIDRELDGRPLPQGSLYAIMYASEQMISDSAFDHASFLWAELRDRIKVEASRRGLTLHGGISIATFSPEELAEVWEREKPRAYFEEAPPPLCHAFVAYICPPEVS